MKQFHRVGILCVLAAGASVSAGPPDVVVRLEPVNSVVQLNDTITLNILADFSVPIIGWGLDLLLSDPGVLALMNPPAIGSDWTPAASSDGDDLAGLAFPVPVTGSDVLLAQLDYQASALGSTALTLGITPGDLNEGFAIDPDGFATFAFESAQVTVIPEPSMCLLVMIGGLGVARFRRRTSR